VQGIIAVLLSLKKKPVVRYEKSSGMAKKLASEVQVIFETCELTWIKLTTITASYPSGTDFVRFSADTSGSVVINS